MRHGGSRPPWHRLCLIHLDGDVCLAARDRRHGRGKTDAGACVSERAALFRSDLGLNVFGAVDLVGPLTDGLFQTVRDHLLELVVRDRSAADESEQ